MDTNQITQVPEPQSPEEWREFLTKVNRVVDVYYPPAQALDEHVLSTAWLMMQEH